MLLTELDETAAAIVSGAEKPLGRLRISAPLLLSQTAMGKIAAGFALKYPYVRLEIITEDRAVDMIEEGYDLVIRVNPAPDEKSGPGGSGMQFTSIARINEIAYEFKAYRFKFRLVWYQDLPYGPFRGGGDDATARFGMNCSFERLLAIQASCKNANVLSNGQRIDVARCKRAGSLLVYPYVPGTLRNHGVESVFSEVLTRLHDLSRILAMENAAADGPSLRVSETFHPSLRLGGSQCQISRTSRENKGFYNSRGVFLYFNLQWSIL